MPPSGRASFARTTRPSRRSSDAAGVFDGNRLNNAHRVLIYRHRQAKRMLHGLETSGRPWDVLRAYSVHHRANCERRFNANMSDAVLPKSRHTRRVLAMTARLSDPSGSVRVTGLLRDGILALPIVLPGRVSLSRIQATTSHGLRRGRVSMALASSSCGQHWATGSQAIFLANRMAMFPR